MRTTTFETTYPKLPFAPLVELALAIGRRIALRQHRHPKHPSPALGAHA